jgi:ABC-2 type transport system permease protein
LRRAYRSTIRFYQGQATGKVTARKPKAKKVVKAQSNFLERQLPFVSNEASAMGLAFFRSIMRAPEIKMMLGTNLLIFLIVGGSMLLRRSAGISDAFKPFIATGAVAVTFFGMSQLMFNLFGADRIGFRMLVLTPVRRERILLGKNLAYLPLAFGIGLILLTLAKFVGRIPVIIIFAATLQLVAAFLLLSIVGNLISVLVPYRIAPGSMKPTKTSTTTTLMLIASHMLFPVTMIPMFLAPVSGLLFSKANWLPAGPVNLFVAALLLTLMIFLYRRSLAPLGKLLQQREMKILEIVTKEIE